MGTLVRFKPVGHTNVYGSPYSPSTMIRSFSFLSTAALIALVSCAPDITNNETPNALLASSSKVTLTATDTATDNFSLICGCTFQLGVDRFWGDTNSIKWQAAKCV